MNGRDLIDTVKEVFLVYDGGQTYVLAWGINNVSVNSARLEPREEECYYDFVVEDGPLDVLTPAAAIAQLPEVTCLQVCVYGQNGQVCTLFKKG